MVAITSLLIGSSITSQGRIPFGRYEYKQQGGIEIAGIPDTSPEWNRPLPGYPIIDGSSSTMMMHAAIRAFLTNEHFVESHSQTYASLERLFPGKSKPADIILAVKYNDEALQNAQEHGADLVITPVAREGFIFLLHEDNPIEILTQQQLRDIYSGKITNWSQIGGYDEEIQLASRNWDSGSQTAMDDFMGGLETVGRNISYSMLMMLDDVRFSGSAGIGYSILSWSQLQKIGVIDEETVLTKGPDGELDYDAILLFMRDNVRELKTVAVDGIKPTNQALSDGSYPLMIYTYSYYNKGNEKAENLTDWLLSEQGQKVIASAGYVGINGQLPPDASPDFDRDEFLSNQAVIDYYHNLPDSRHKLHPDTKWPSQRYQTYVRFEDGNYHEFYKSYRIANRDLAYALAEDRGKDVTVLRLAHFDPYYNEGDLIFRNHRYIVLTREKGGEFEVIYEGLAPYNIISQDIVDNY